MIYLGLMIYLLNRWCLFRLTSITRSLWLNFLMVLFHTRVLVVIELNWGCHIALFTNMIKIDKKEWWQKTNHGVLITTDRSKLIESIELGPKTGRVDIVKKIFSNLITVLSQIHSGVDEYVGVWSLCGGQPQKRWQLVEKHSFSLSLLLISF